MNRADRTDGTVCVLRRTLMLVYLKTLFVRFCFDNDDDSQENPTTPIFLHVAAIAELG